MKTLLAALATLLLVPYAQADTAGSISGRAPRTYDSAVRVIPSIGTASFQNGSATMKNNQTAGGLFVDLGSSYVVGETGILSMGGNVNTNNNAASVSVSSWSVPVLAKINFSGHPQSTVFAKVGAMTYDTNQTNMQVMGVAGLGGAIPLGHNSALNLDATYNRLFSNNADFTDYQGIALLGGLSFGF